jgi:hypothetical protein
MAYGLLLIVVGVLTFVTYAANAPIGCLLFCDENARLPPPPGLELGYFIVGFLLEHALYYGGVLRPLLSGSYTLVGAQPSPFRGSPGVHMLLLAHVLANTAISVGFVGQMLWAGWRLIFAIVVLLYGAGWLPLLALAILLQAPLTALHLLSKPCRGKEDNLFELGVVRAAMRACFPSATLLLRSISTRTLV